MELLCQQNKDQFLKYFSTRSHLFLLIHSQHHCVRRKYPVTLIQLLSVICIQGTYFYIRGKFATFQKNNGKVNSKLRTRIRHEGPERE
jgi:hypothetical protein